MEWNMAHEKIILFYYILYDVMRMCETEGKQLKSVQFETIRDRKTNLFLFDEDDLRLLSKVSKEEITIHLKIGYICFRDMLLRTLT